MCLSGKFIAGYGLIIAANVLLTGCSSGSVSPVVASVTAPYTIRLIAGALTGPGGSTDGAGGMAYFNNPGGLAMDSNNNIYVADTNNDDIRRITPQGVVTTWAGTAGSAGSTNATGTTATFNHPHAIAIDQSGTVYVADTGNNLIRKITPDAVVSTLAGTVGVAGSADATGTAASFNEPLGLVVDSNGNVYVADSLNSTIRKISAAGVVTTLAGKVGSMGKINGSGNAAQFNEPEGLAIDALGSIYVADTLNHEVRMITPAGVVSTLAGTGNPGMLDGTSSVAELDQPVAVAMNDSGVLFVLDKNAQSLRKISNGSVSTLLTATSTTNGVLWSQLPVPLAMVLNTQQQPVFASSYGIFQGLGF